MKKIFLAASAAAALSLGAFAECSRPPVIRAMTWNIRYSAGDRLSPVNNWLVRRGDLLRQIEKMDPDVAGFQEALPDQRKWLEDNLPGYAFTGEGRNADRKSGESSPVMFRKSRFEALKSGTFWLSETPEIPGSKSWNSACPRICTYAILKDKATGRTFAFANTHADHRSEEAREKGMQLIIERMKEFDAPVVFTGDHNSCEWEKPARAVAGALKDALYLSESEPQGSWRTFTGWKWLPKEITIAEALAKDETARSEPGDGFPGMRIDYIYVSRGARVLAYRTWCEARPGLEAYASDHFPSTADIILP